MRYSQFCTAASGHQQREPHMSTVKKLPTRAEVASGDSWDLSSLYPSDAAWEQDFGQFEQKTQGYTAFSGRLGKSPQDLAECLQFDLEIDQLAERLGTYAFLKSCEDQSNSTYQALVARFQNVAVKAGQMASYIRPEILAIPGENGGLSKVESSEAFGWSSNACCDTRSTHWASGRRPCWPCKVKWPRRPARLSPAARCGSQVWQSCHNERRRASWSSVNATFQPVAELA